MAQLYDAINDLRDELSTQFRDLRSDIQNGYPPVALCDERHKAVEKLSGSVDDLRKKVYIGVGIAITASLFVPLLVEWILK